MKTLKTTTLNALCNSKKVVLTTLIASAMGLAPLTATTALADDHGGAGGGQKGAQQKGKGSMSGDSSKGHGGGSGQVKGKILSTMDDSDSDAPAWAKGQKELNPHRPGSEGKPGTAGSKKGDDYGDLWVLLRDNNGVPILDENGQEQPIVIIDGVPTVVQLEDPDGDGHYELPAEYADLVQEVELGRSNVTRAPSSVLEHSLEEALSKLDGLTLTTDMVTESGMLVVDGATIDSPLENLALYQALLLASDTNNDGVLEMSVDYSGESGSGTYTFLVPASVQLDLAASLLAAGSDKTASLTVDRVATVSDFLGVSEQLSNLLDNYTYDGSATSYGDTTTWVNVQVDGLSTPDDLSDDIYQPVELNLVTGTTITYNGTEIHVPGVSFETIPNTIDENLDGILDSNDEGDLDGMDGFTQATDDALQVIEFVHDFGL